MHILAIETSCDETAAAVIEVSEPCILKVNRGGEAHGQGRAERLGPIFSLGKSSPVSLMDTGERQVKILSNVIASQIKIHQKYGGIFPEMASRAHAEKIIPVVEQASACYKPDVVAVTTGPGLIGSLLIGVNFAKTYAFAKKLPIMGINHLSGHLYSNWAEKPFPQLPAIILIVSGGHTGLYLMKSHTKIQTLGETMDDAAGEAFDKVAKLLGLGYPGGPAIAAAAAKVKSYNLLANFRNCQGNYKSYEVISSIKLPRPMLDSGDYNFSFSGLKTAVLYEIRKNQRLITQSRGEAANHHKSLVASEFQQAVIDVLISKTIRAAYEFCPKSICLCGGVSANKELRVQLKMAVEKLPSKTSYHIPPMALTTDNAAMIGIAAAYQIDQKQLAHRSFSEGWDKITANANLKL